MDIAALSVSPSVCNSAGKTWHHCDESIVWIVYVLLTVQPNIIIVFFLYQLDAQILYINTFIIVLYMFRALLCSSSGGQLY